MYKQGGIKLGVSLYSYQDNFYFHRHDLEGCMAAAAGAGAEGIEVFADTMMPEWPYISDAFTDKWYGLLYRYGLEPVCLDHFSDRAMWKNKQLTDDELYERGVLYIKTAHKLGCKNLRVLHHEHIGLGISPYRLTDAKLVERLLPAAREYDVMLALECHAPTTIDDPVHEAYLEAAERRNIPYVGLQADFSSYEYCVSTADIELCVHNGCSRGVLERLRTLQRDAYFEGRPFVFDEVKREFDKMPLNDCDRAYLDMSIPVYGTSMKYMGVTQYNGGYRPTDWTQMYKTLKDYASKLVYVHGKFYDIDENGQVDNMDYPKIFDALKSGGYKGYICSEFEGNRRLNVKGWCDEITYVNKHHKLMRKCLEA
ncbi:MAG: sugar phosphate isomerase/epimerase [Clostridiales bacterium]|jgi:sugar phosphate isomerase/epimerase|nr:sugar phosphate isomerase/epimerase [Clostridiales bacterium]